jgi:hypothetical protein
LNNQAETIYKIDKNNLRPTSKDTLKNKFIRYKTDKRDPKRKIDNDEVIIVDFDKIPEAV